MTQRQRLMSVILATQEVEIRKIVVRNQPQANSSGDPTSKKLITKKDWQAKCQWLTPVILATQEAEIRRIAVQSQP
jgi:hypothetical protein